MGECVTMGQNVVTSKGIEPTTPEIKRQQDYHYSIETYIL
jgi:hypothetical protein